MSTNLMEKRKENPEVDRFQDRHFECGSCTSLVLVTQMYLLPLEKSIKHVQVLKETIDLIEARLSVRRCLLFCKHKIKLNTS